MPDFDSAAVRRASIAAILVAIFGAAAWMQAQSSVQVGYSVLSRESGTPTGSALFSYVNSSNVLVTEAGVGAAEAVLSGRILVDEAGTQTTLAMVNTSTQTANANLILRNSSGQETGREPITVAPGDHKSSYVRELFRSLPPNFRGSLTFESDRPLTAMTLREGRNAHQEPLYTTLPVAAVNAPPDSQPLVFPHIAVGGGYASQLILINTSSEVLRGRVYFYASEGGPLSVLVENSTVADFAYELAAHGTYQVELNRPSGVGVGYAAAVPDSGSRAPAGSLIFQFKFAGQLMTEAGVGAVRATTAARIYVDYIGTETGVAIANPGDVPSDVTFTLMDRFGAQEVSVTRTLPPRSHLARFVHQLFPTVANGYTGLLEIRSSNPVAPITLKQTFNTRNDLIMTTLPVADLTAPVTAGSLVFPHVALGGGFTTRIILLNASAATAASGSLSFTRSDGSSWVLPMGGAMGGRFDYQITAGGGRRYYPGNSDAVSTVSLIDPASNRPTTELVINEGNRVPLRLRVLDEKARPRDDFDLTVASLDQEVATVNNSSVEGKRAGFSTLTIGAGGRLITATATVVKVDAGARGFDTTGIVQDAARRFYLTSSQDNTILLAAELTQPPALYAGVSRSPGLRNEVRLQSLFRNPTFLTLNQADGSLYVSDGANHVLRKVRTGTEGRVETAAGTGTAGSQDGPVLDAGFNTPQGLALDGRGNLWVADSGNHTVRRINLASGRVETIAGKAGTSGSADGRGEEARFQSPAGIAFEPETAYEQMERLRVGGAPPPVKVVVADTGNGRIRRVFESGEVETLRSVQTSPAISAMASSSEPGRAFATTGEVLTFVAPQGVAVDSIGNIYVSEPQLDQIRVILRTGEVVSAVQPGTLKSPRGIAVGPNGTIAVASPDIAIQEFEYGGPRVSSITPNRLAIEGGEKVTIHGNNFSPDTQLVVSGVLIVNRTVENSQAITFTAPPLPSGRGVLSVQNRGGLSQTSVVVDAVPLSTLAAGHITTIAGGSTFAGEGGSALAAPIVPAGLAVDSSGNIFLADSYNHRVRRIDGRSGRIVTIAGTGINGREGDNGPAIAAELNTPMGVAFDPQGNLLIGEGNRIRKVDSTTGIISTIVGGGNYGYCGDNIPAIGACFAWLTAFAVDSEGNLYLNDYYNRRTSRVDGRTNIITTIAGNGDSGFSGDFGDARSASVSSGFGVAVDDAHKILYISTGDGRVRRLDLTTNVITTAMTDVGPIGLALDGAGNLFVSTGDQVHRLDYTTRQVARIAGGGTPADRVGDGGLATAAELGRAGGLTLDGSGNLFISDFEKYRVRRVSATTQVITTVAGNGTPFPLGDGDLAVLGTLRDPSGLSLDFVGNLYITDSGNDRIRKVDAVTKTITTFAGGGDGREDNILPTDARLSGPTGRVAIDTLGNVYIADYARVSKIDSFTNRISRFAGNDRGDSPLGDGGPALLARVIPKDLAVDRSGNLYIAESNRIRKVNVSTGVITTVAGGGQPASGIGDNGPAASAALGLYIRIAVDAAGNLFIADWENGRVRRVDAATQIITTVAGGGAARCGLNQLATSVTILPMAIEVDDSGNPYFADGCWAYGVRRISPGGMITSVAGHYPNLADNIPATRAYMDPSAVALDREGNLIIADRLRHRIRVVRAPIP